MPQILLVPRYVHTVMQVQIPLSPLAVCCRRALWLPLLTALALLSAGAAWCQTEPLTKVSVVITDADHPPLVFQDAEGTFRGILPDQWALWSQKTGIKVELKAMSPENARRSLREGRAEIMEAVAHTDAYANLRFSRPHTLLNIPVYTHKSLGGIADAPSLKGFTIGVKIGDPAARQLAGRGVPTLKEYPSYEAVILAAKRREIMVIAMSELPLVYFLCKHGMAQEFHRAFTLCTANMHRAVDQRRTGLAQAVENGFKKISRGEYMAIERKWRGAPFLLAAFIRHWWPWIAAAGVGVLALAISNLVLARYARRKSAALLASRGYFAIVCDLIKDALLELDPATGSIINVNRSMCEMFGYASPKEVLAAGLGALCSGKPPYTVNDARAWMRKAAEQGPQVFEWQARQRNGCLFWVEINMRRVKIGAEDRLFFSARDITERRRAAQELALALHRYSLLEKQNRIVTWTIDLQGLYTNLGAEVVDVWQYRAEELVGKIHFYEMHPDQGRAEFQSRLLKNLAHGRPCRNLVHPFAAKSGDIIWLNSNSIPLYDEHGKLAGAWGTSADITELKRAESENANIQERLMHIQRLESIGRFAGTVAHDFNNMLQGILGYTDLALEQVPADQTLHADLEEIKKTTRRATKLTGQLQTFARSQSVAPQILLLNEALENMTGMLRRLLGDKIQLIWKPGGQALAIRMDPGQLEQIMTNLCANARDAIEQSGRVVIETEQIDLAPAETARHGGITPGQYALLSVRDDGCGMTPEVRDRIFEPFFTTKARGQGAGLGLSAVYGMVAQNGGHVNVVSTPGRGSLFQIFLPRCAPEKTAPATSPADSAGGPSPHGTILLVDDEEPVLCTTQRILEHSGCRVLATNSARAALNLFKEHHDRIDLVIADVMMPELSGPELVRQLLKQHPRLKYMFISGHSANFLAEQGVNGDAENFIQKPFTQRALAEKVQACLARP